MHIPGIPTIDWNPEAPREWAARSLAGTFSGVIATLWLDPRVVAQTVPVGTSINLEKHPILQPVLLFVGEQLDVHPRVFGYRFQFNSVRRYGEVLLALPNLVTSNTGTNPAAPVTFFARLYLDRWIPILLGRWPLGWNKVKADITLGNDRMQVRNRRRRTLIDLETQPGGDLQESQLTNAKNQLRQWLAQPVLFGRNRRYHVTTIDFNWPSASVDPIDADLKTGRGLMRQMPPMTQHLHWSAGAEGAFRVAIPWRMSTCYLPLRDVGLLTRLEIASTSPPSRRAA